MKKKIFYLLTVLFSLYSLQASAQADITLTISLDEEFDLNTLVVAPATVYDHINKAIDDAFEALGGGETRETHKEYVKTVVLTGSAPYCYYDLRGVKDAFIHALETVDLSAAKLVDNKIQAPLQVSGDKYAENPWAGIESGAFAVCTKLKTVILPPDLENIGAKTFGRCSQLTNLILPETLNTIGIDAFNSCSALTIPNGLPEGMSGNIGAGAFNGCSKLELTTLPVNFGITGDAGAAFMGCTLVKFTVLNEKIAGDASKNMYAKELFKNSGVAITRIPDVIYEINENAFENCSDITTITFPESMGGRNSRINSNIKNRAFALPAGSTVERTYIFEAWNPPVDGTAENAFHRGDDFDREAWVLVPNTAAVKTFKNAGVPYSEMNIRAFNGTLTIDEGEYGTVTTDYGKIEEGILYVKMQDEVTFTFTPVTGYEVAEVLINDEKVTLTDENTYTFTIEGDYNIGVTYARNIFVITVDDGGNGVIGSTYGEITEEGIIEVKKGEDITFSFTPDYGYEITGVSVDGEMVELTDESTYTLTQVTDDHEISVTYARNIFVIRLTGENGQATTAYGDISEEATIDVHKGDAITFTFSANAGYEIAGVFLDGESVELTEENSYTLPDVQEDHTFSVEYRRNLFTITIEAGENGSVITGYGEISGDGTIDVKRGDDITFTFTPDHEYEITEVLLNGAGIELTGENTYTLTNVTEDYRLTVTFDLPRSIKEASPSAIRIYPHPVKDVLNIFGVEDGTTIELYDLSGRKIMETNETTVHVSSLTKGIYFVKIKKLIVKAIKE